MLSTAHAHPVDAATVRKAQASAITAGEAEALGQILALISDPIRVRMLFALVAVEELCVGDLALALDVSMDQSSYALKQLRSARFVQNRRDGRVLYDRLADGFPRQLLEHCLQQLLTIASKETSS